MCLASSTTLMSPSMEVLWLKESGGSSPIRDAAEVIHSPRRGPTFRRSLSTTKKTSFSAEKADAKLRGVDAESSQALLSPSSLSNLSAWITTVFQWKKSLHHILYFTFAVLVLIGLAIKLLCVGWLTFTDVSELPNSLVQALPSLFMK